MADNAGKSFAKIVDAQKPEILKTWSAQLVDSGILKSGRIKEAELTAQETKFLDLFSTALTQGSLDVDGGAYAPLKEYLAEISRSRAVQGFTPTETATFVFSLKKALQKAIDSSGDKAAKEVSWDVSLLLDALGLYTTEMFLKSREEVVVRQQQEIAELSTPVVKLWEGVLALPLIGTLDSNRTQVVMENLLQSIVSFEASIAIIDITGVPTVDTLVAQHLLRTIAAARLMGADCLISGIRPQIAQTMVHLGVDLNVVSKANLSDAFALALQKTGRRVVKVAPAVTK